MAEKQAVKPANGQEKPQTKVIDANKLLEQRYTINMARNLEKLLDVGLFPGEASSVVSESRSWIQTFRIGLEKELQKAANQ